MSLLRTALVGVFAFALFQGVVFAQVRKTAVVNLARDQAAGALAAESLRAALDAHPTLRPLGPGVLARSLEEAAPDIGPEAEILKRSRALLKKAEAELASFRTSAALRLARDAEAELLGIAPNDAQRELLADVAFFSGRVHLREQNRGLARSSFELVRRLSPTFPSPDPGRFNPDIVSTFKEARERTREGSATLEVTTTYDGAEIYLDGARVGTTPLAIDVSPGAHYIAASSPEYRVAAERVDVGSGDNKSVRMELAPLPAQDVGLRLRKQAIAANTAVGGPRLVELTKAISALTGADSTLVIRGTAGDLEIAAFRNNHKRGTRFRTLDGGAENMVALLAPVRTLRPEELFSATPKPRRWYERSEFIAGAVGVGFGLLAVGVFAIAASDGDPGTRPALPGSFPGSF